MAKNKEVVNIIDQYIYVEKPTKYTGVITMDLVLAGYKPGKVYEISSPSQIGKTTTVLYMCKEFIESGDSVLYIDSEDGVDNKILENMDLKKYLGTKLKIVKSYTFKSTTEILDAALGIKPKSSKPLFNHVVIDSIAMLTKGRRNVEKEYSNTFYNFEMAMERTRLLKDFKPEFGSTNVTCWLINQFRTKSTGFMGGTKQDTAGGNIEQYAPDVKIKFKKLQILEEVKNTADGVKKVPIGSVVEVKAQKNRLEYGNIGVPMVIIFGHGPNNAYSLLKMLENRGMITSDKNNYEFDFYGKKNSFKGLDKILTYLRDNLQSIVGELKTRNHFKLILDENTSSENMIANSEIYSVDGIENAEEVEEE